MVIWKDINVIIKHKCTHIRKIGGKAYHAFITDFGDIPIARWNDQTKQMEECVNLRGRAYAARKRLKHRKKLK